MDATKYNNIKESCKDNVEFKKSDTNIHTLLNSFDSSIIVSVLY